ncbi:MAG: translation initiation factor IF-2 [Candidatus Woesearchaeota archaeon]
MAKKKGTGPEIRSPICTTLGHVDHGKSTLLDSIRGSSIVNTEAGKITQSIGASIVPLDTIKKICGKLLDSLGMKFTIPGLLFIDTPGHAAFTSLRKRGGNLADIAILVVDINEGFKPQTIEALEILKKSKTPFVVAANKIDLISGFTDFKGPLLENINKQSDNVKRELDTKHYELVGKLSEFGLNSERYDRVEDYTQQVAIIPTSAKQGIGMPEILMLISGLAQRFLEDCLHCNLSGPARGVVLEVKEEKGLGKTIDVIIYDGTIHVNDLIGIGGLDEPITTRVKALLEPAPLSEIRDKKAKFKSVKQITAACGVKISGPELDKVIAGMPLAVYTKETEEDVLNDLQEEIEEVIVDKDDEGIVIKADSIGSLEALMTLLREHEVPIRRASIGDISKKDVIEAQTNCEKEPLYAVILGFNVKSEQPPSEVKIITNDIIYKLLDDLFEWQKQKQLEQETEEYKKLTKPAKLRIMEGYIFRQCNPAVVGVDVLAGVLKSNTNLMNLDGKTITRVKGIQHEQKNIEEAEKNKEVAVSMEGVIVGRQIKENDILYTAVSEDEFKRFKEFKKLLSQEEKDLLKEIADIKRKNNPVWGV